MDDLTIPVAVRPTSSNPAESMDVRLLHLSCAPATSWSLVQRSPTVCVFGVGDRGSSVVKVTCYKSESRWFDPSLVSLEFFFD